MTMRGTWHRPGSSGLRSRAAALLSILVVLVAGVPALGQAPAEYVLGPGDVLEVSVWGFPDLTRTVVVRPDGKTGVPLLGEIEAAGLTVAQLTQQLAKAYAVYIRRPQVSVIVKEFRTIRVSVLGPVAKPGTYVLQPEARLLDLLSAAGGLGDLASLRDAQILRPGHAPAVVDLERALAGDASANVALRTGDMLVVVEDLVNIVNVVGEVARPGRYRLKGEMRVLDVLLLAGGLTEKASVAQARIVRGRDSHALGLDALLLKQDMNRNISLQAGDTLFIPEDTDNKIYVLGDVNSPGVFALKGNVTLLQAIAMAGGPVQRGAATARSIQVVRRTGDGKQLIAGAGRVEALPNGGAVMTVDLEAMIRGDATRDVAVQPGDVVVLRQTTLGGMQVILNILSGLGSLFLIFR